jgi:hypothetical protein
MAKEYKSKDKELPRNRNLPSDSHRDKLLRDLDCAVIEFMHKQMVIDGRNEFQRRGFSKIKMFDSTRGIFTEGGPAFEGSEIMAKTHSQICIRNLNCIKGFFLPRREMNYIPWLEPNQPRSAA